MTNTFTFKVKGRELKRVGGIFMTYLRKGLWLEPRTQRNFPFQSLHQLFQLLPWQLATVMALMGMPFSMLMYYNEQIMRLKIC